MTCINRNNQGFTLLEIIITLLIVGILAAISAPSFIELYNRSKVDNALTQVRGALQQAQREAIRKSKYCTVNINSATNEVTGNCLIEPDFETGVEIKSNENSIQFTYRGTITLSDAGTIVFYTQDNPNISENNKCLVISSPLGIIRSGTYTGDVTSSISSDDCEN